MLQKILLLVEIFNCFLWLIPESQCLTCKILKEMFQTYFISIPELNKKAKKIFNFFYTDSGSFYSEKKRKEKKQER